MGLITSALLILVLGAGAVQPARPPDHTGYAVRYGPAGPKSMRQVAINRGIEPTPHMAAFTFADDSDMGRLWLHVKGPAGEADFLVVDLPRPGKDKENLKARGVAVELDYYSGFLICGSSWHGRAADCPITWRTLRR